MQKLLWLGSPFFGAELRACGRNLNQLTVLAHQGHVHTVNLRAAADALSRTYDAVNALLTQKR